MSPDLIALIFWSVLGLSLVLTVAGLLTGRSGPVFAAAVGSFVFGVAAILSIGIFILALAVAQVAIGVAIRRQAA